MPVRKAPAPRRASSPSVAPVSGEAVHYTSERYPPRRLDPESPHMQHLMPFPKHGETLDYAYRVGFSAYLLPDGSWCVKNNRSLDLVEDGMVEADAQKLRDDMNGELAHRIRVVLRD